MVGLAVIIRSVTDVTLRRPRVLAAESFRADDPLATTIFPGCGIRGSRHVSCQGRLPIGCGLAVPDVLPYQPSTESATSQAKASSRDLKIRRSRDEALAWRVADSRSEEHT